MGIVTSTNEPVTIYYDNQIIIAYTKDNKYYEKIKQFDIKYNYVKDIISWDEVILQYINTCQIMTYPHTKLTGQDLYKSNVITMWLRLMCNVSRVNHSTHNDWTIIFMVVYI